MTATAPQRQLAARLSWLAHGIWNSFQRHQGTLRASALSFDVTLGLVPLLALIFVVLRQVGVQHVLEPFLLEQLAGGTHESGARLLAYVERAKVHSLGAFGVAGILIAFFMLLDNVREAFNAIAEVPEQRGVLRRGVDYLVLVCAVPVLLFVTFGITTMLQSRWLFHWLGSKATLGWGLMLLLRLTPFVCSSLVLLLVYLLLPAAPVRFRSALLGGFLTGACWQLAHWVYFHFQFGITRYNLLYGALALVPFLLIWIYTSWLLVLFGFELVCWYQHGRLALRNVTSPQGTCADEDAA